MALYRPSAATIATGNTRTSGQQGGTPTNGTPIYFGTQSLTDANHLCVFAAIAAATNSSLKFRPVTAGHDTSASRAKSSTTKIRVSLPDA